MRSLSPTLTRLFSVAGNAATTTKAQANGPLSKRKLGVAACGIAAVSALGCGYLYAQQHKGLPLASSSSKSPVVLVLDLDKYRVAENPMNPPQTLAEVVDALHHAGKDERVKGIVAYVGDSEGPPSQLAQVQELRDAVLHFRDMKQHRVPTIAYFDSSEAQLNGTTLGYHLATAFKQIYVQPHGFVCFSGLAEEQFFFRPLLDRLQAKPYAYCREEYKNVYNCLTHKGYNKAHKEATQTWLNSCMKQIVVDVAAARGLSHKQVLGVVDSFPLTAEEAVALGLIDGVKSKLDAAHYITHHSGHQANASPNSTQRPTASTPETATSDIGCGSVYGDAPVVQQGPASAQRFHAGTTCVTTDGSDSSQTEACMFLPFTEYMEDVVALKARDLARRPGIAILRISGEVGHGNAGTLPGKIDSHEICKNLRRASEASNIQAIVLRIDSPGGSALATDEIWDEVLRVKASGKRVIASMGNMAASAGYEVAAAADMIVAQPGTLTGSIGVVDGKLNFAPALKQLGVNVDAISVGKHALMHSYYTGSTRQEDRWINAMLDRCYKDFVVKVAARRHMRLDVVHKVAKGRIWTGQDAFQLGLVDELGGLTRAIALAKQLAHLPQDDCAVDVQEWTSAGQLGPLVSSIPMPLGPLATCSGDDTRTGRMMISAEPLIAHD